MFRTQSPTSPMTHTERRVTPRRGDVTARAARIHPDRDFGVGYGSSSGYASSHRERDFGIGYGTSSGYASNRSYAAPQAVYFRCR